MIKDDKKWGENNNVSNCFVATLISFFFSFFKIYLTYEVYFNRISSVLMLSWRRQKTKNNNNNNKKTPWSLINSTFIKKVRVWKYRRRPFFHKQSISWIIGTLFDGWQIICKYLAPVLTGTAWLMRTCCGCFAIRTAAVSCCCACVGYSISQCSGCCKIK